MDKLSWLLPVCQLDWLDPEFNHSFAVSVAVLLLCLLLVL